MKIKWNDFERMCIELENRKCYMCQRNNYICAKSKVKQYIGTDTNKLKSLKSEALASDFMQFSGFVFSVLALFISTTSMLLSATSGKIVKFTGTIIDEMITATIDTGHDIQNSVIVALTMFLIAYILRMLKPTVATYKWRNYILIVIEELEEETRKNGGNII